MIRDVKYATSLPVAVLTNGSLLYRAEVREELLAADAVLPTLDAGTEDVYQRVNRPRPELTFERLVGGLQAFRRVYVGRLWVEVMLVKGLNDSDEALGALAAVLERIRPDEVHVTRPVRPPAEGWVEAPDDATLERATAILGGRAHVVPAKKPTLDLSGYVDVDEAILDVLSRHPMTLEDLKGALGRWGAGGVDPALARLEATEKVREIRRLGKVFWAPAEGRYGWPPPEDPEPRSSE